MASTTRYLRNFSLLLWLLACAVYPAWADTISVRRAEAELVDGQLLVSTRFNIKMTSGLNEALTQGVPLTFRLDFELFRPRLTSYYLNVSNGFSPHSSIAFKLFYQSLTNRYRVSIGSFSNYYPSVSEALRSVGAIQGWRVLSPGDLSVRTPDQVAGRVRLSLDISELPKPYQLNALGSSDWTLSSNWVSLDVKGSN
jgi:hypothetical protein